MTPKEFKAAAADLAMRMGPKMSISVFIDTDYIMREGVLHATVHYDWPHKADSVFRLQAEDFAALLIALEVKWNDHKAEHRKQSIRKMALAIIRITAEQGHCTDAALRQDFQADEVDTYGTEACADANTIAGKGPFEILTLGGANGAPADVTARVQ